MSDNALTAIEGHVLMRHAGINAEATVAATAVPELQAKGWELVDPDVPAATPDVRSTEPQEDADLGTKTKEGA